MSNSKVSGGFLGWTRPVPPEQWDAQSPVLLQAAQAYREVEQVINYTFRDKGFLVQAFTHFSYPPSSRVVPGYMRPMDFLGDAMIKSLLTTQLYGSLHPLGPRTLTQARAHLECNRLFGFVVVRHGWQRLFRVGSAVLSEAIVEYVKDIGDGEYPAENGASPPKALADLFESLACAVYLDSNQDLAAMWRAMYPLLRPYVESEVSRTAANSALTLF
ncbi:endoribonuclease Dicer-like [Dermacentor silvarum]|uniref:endoribonuclease Dicer-like n=1 Tax=Dermacentor silvarum TaxID=543639 RepID=UPI0018987F50|nr:endoribonuclease Dicer-like [Dermacentor silvarum]